ncbi:N-6 DNA methylase [Candidatus Pacearchaeota archaeon]|nr:N-6 DNA methylase [Candidatus Pacearchaeota archaeon]
MVSKEEAREELQKLIKKYEKYKEDKDLMRNERQVCDSLIRPFFRDVLGWDVEDAYEFKSEYTQGGKRMDYMACIEGVSQFVVEAKAPSREVKDNTSFYRQTIQYAESKGKDFAVLTNFRYFIIFRAGIETRGPLVNEIIKIDLLNLTEQGFDFLWYFSKEFWIEKGEENPLYSVKNLKKKRSLDEVLVEDMSKWREYLLRSLKVLSKGKYDFENEEELEYIEEEVQRFVDRLIFICYCEDKQLNDNELKPLLHEYRSKHIGKKTFIINQIKKLFETYNKTYNSDLFKKGLCDEFEFDDNILSEILEDLRGYYEGLPYDFSVIDADILGRAYENFLGHIITGKKRFKEKKDIGKRKKMGIYYTPQYIVNYIIKNTVKEYIKDKSFDEILKVKILDPACGSGSFLIKVFDVLVEESKAKLKRELTYEEKKKLMLNCIHGVDLDERACDIAKLNLSLKLATRKEKLPELHKNIQNGNSLIDDPEVAGDKAFKWEEKFPFKFDVVVGNPPYVFGGGQGITENEKKFFKKNYSTATKKLNLFSLFIEKSLKILKNKGLFSFILPNTILRVTSYEDIRKLMLEKSKINQIVDLSTGVFEGVTASTIIIVLARESDDNKIKINKVKISHGIGKEFILKPQVAFHRKLFIFDLRFNEKENKIIEKMKRNSIKLGDICKEMIFGVVITKNKREVIFNKKIDIRYKKFLEGKDIDRYLIKFSDKYLLYEKPKLHRARTPDIFEVDEKILVQRISGGKRPLKAAYDSEQYYDKESINNIILQDKNYDPKFIMALINSSLINWYYSIKFTNVSTLTVNVSKAYLGEIPIKQISKKEQTLIIKFVSQMLELQKKFHDEKTLRKDKLKEEIEKTDGQIDQEVYKLYGLTNEEIKIVEESLR